MLKGMNVPMTEISPRFSTFIVTISDYEEKILHPDTFAFMIVLESEILDPGDLMNLNERLFFVRNLPRMTFYGLT